jgi:hypothetical protein
MMTEAALLAAPIACVSVFAYFCVCVDLIDRVAFLLCASVAEAANAEA